MRIPIPEQTLEIIKDLTARGDYARISEKVYGTDANRYTIKAAIKNGEGSVDVVRAIVQFYDEKKKVMDEFNYHA